MSRVFRMSPVYPPLCCRVRMFFQGFGMVAWPLFLLTHALAVPVLLWLCVRGLLFVVTG